MQLAVRCWCACVVVALAFPVFAADDEETPEVEETIVEAESAEPLNVGSWLNSPPGREAVAFDAYFNRVYFNAEGKVVGRYNRRTKKFQAGEFRTAQWHNISAAPKEVASNDSADAKNTSDTGDGATTSTGVIVDWQGDGAKLPAKPAEIFRRGAAGGARAFSQGRVKVIETPR